jgi:hypothetical protein
LPPANRLASRALSAQIGRMDRYGHREGGMGWTARIVLAILALVILGAIGLGIYGSTLKPPHQTYTVVIPSSRFPS